MSKEFQIGDRLGLMTVILINSTRMSKRGVVHNCLLRCDCGKEWVSDTTGIVKAKKAYCRCAQRESASKPKTHGFLSKNSDTWDRFLARKWSGIKDRCYNFKNDRYPRYGARGIVVCDEWKDDFIAFKDWVNNNLGRPPKGYTIDRIDNDRGYFPDNLRWADKKTQSVNRGSVRIIHQYSLEGIFIQSFPTVRAANLAMNQPKNNMRIHTALKRPKNKTLGFLWSYA